MGDGGANDLWGKLVNFLLMAVQDSIVTAFYGFSFLCLSGVALYRAWESRGRGRASNTSPKQHIHEQSSTPSAPSTPSELLHSNTKSTRSHSSVANKVPLGVAPINNVAYEKYVSKGYEV